MLPVDNIRKKLLTQRHSLFRQAAQTEDEPVLTVPLPPKSKR